MKGEKKRYITAGRLSNDDDDDGMMGPGDTSAVGTLTACVGLAWNVFWYSFFYVKFLVINKLLIEFFLLRYARVVAFIVVPQKVQSSGCGNFMRNEAKR